jgi:metal-dependent amidase/aminoacylase/carboxypeptidase family protein
MNTPLTDASTVIVHAAGKAFAVVPASVSQMLELRRTNLELSQDMAWAIIKLADWTNQSSSWQASARDWQQNLYVQRELPLNYIPGPRPQPTEENPKTLPEALKLIAELRQERHDLDIRLKHAEIALDELETIVSSIEHETHTRTIQQN